jgi:Kef-type K+ transport system membrane component KefB
VFLGVIVWLILASSITLEQGQETAAQWGSAAALIVGVVVVLLAVGRVAWIPLRAIARRLRRRVDRRFR